MRSLRWRIATWYALLLIAVLVALTFAITVKFEHILEQQAEARVSRTMQEIQRVALPEPNFFNIIDTSGESLRALLSSANLQQWSGPNTYVQVDSPQGFVLAKSSNMGALQFPPAPEDLAPNTPFVQRVSLPHAAPFLVEVQILQSGDQRAIVHVGESMDQLLQAFEQTRQAIGIILGLAILAVVALSLVLAAQATNPINELTQAMREIGSDRLNRRLKWANRQDEVGKLAETFDDLLARLEEAFARERQFISDASHELKTPLTSINANAQLLARWGDRDETIRKESLDTIIKESSSLAGMVSGMLTLAKAESGDAIPKEPVSLAAIANEAAEGARQRAAEKGLDVRVEVGGDLPVVVADPHLLRQLVSNLIDNAIKFTEEGGVTVRVRGEGNEAIVEVEDSGPGIDPEELAFIFDRFYRTDKSRNRAIPGTGLGLAIVRSIARVHGGQVEAERAPDGGALFRARFPRADEAA
ncbi:MAG: HAMP domain-containing histidine kinase [Candidatus Eremiobacteraeota bacterium]|nr:HAMP domain-containing histidine kinase [Candidatus Eremiobacteraeota bacterium]